ncbi:AAA family ATPase [Shewanella xiamenensis]|uniref:AAA family ATPase n=1 Tax=Shewanella xiamenensis TaxID=332186 RepID=UPI001F07051B|nr:AAA family ATPase [Shewanella xiamenensis]UML92144.1 ATP-binding protein [Shewanella xiamenensis]
MKIEFINEYLSISDFDSYEIPEFTLITGLNGSGKTHLLKAIETGSIRTNLKISPNINSRPIAYFNYQTLAPNRIEPASSSNLIPYQGILAKITEEKNNLLAFIKAQLLKNYNIIFSDNYFNYEKLEINTNILELGINVDSLNNINNSIKHQISQIAILIRSNFRNILDLSDLSDCDLLNAEHEKIINTPVINKADSIFSQSFSRAFLLYHELVKFNKLVELDHLNGDTNEPLTEKEFINLHGTPPWEIANELFKDAGLDFYLTHPEKYTTVTFSPQLKKISNNKIISIDTLSSGEKILMSFAICLLHSQNSRNAALPPNLLLLDEIDASLHPQMSKQLLNVVINNIVKKQGINVIMTTHSPSTVALAPEESIYVKHSEDPKLQKSSKDEAINILTSGIPTLSININSRKNVFVESKSDEFRYSYIYDQLKTYLQSPFSLNFIAMGSKKSTGEDIGSGCKNVITMVDKLRKAKNNNIYGLIDWDTDSKRTSNNHIQVLGYGKWHAIENCILDPLILLLYLLDHSPKIANKFIEDDNIHYNNLLTSEKSIIQSAVNRLQTFILGINVSNENKDSIEFEYRGGIKLSISKVYAHYRGHDLAELITEKISSLNNYKNNTDNLLKVVMEKIFKQHDKAIPVDIIDDFRQLLNK